MSQDKVITVNEKFFFDNSSNLSQLGTSEFPAPGSTNISLGDQLLQLFYCLLFLLTILGNLLVCAALYCDRRLRSPTNWFVVSLAVSDLFYACLSLPFRIARNEALSIHACRFWIWTDMVCAAASIANLAVISIDRRLKITRPFVYQYEMTSSRAFFAIAGVWTYAISLASLSLVTWPGEKGIFVNKKGSCFNQNRIFYTVAVLVGFLSPLVVLVLNYCFVYVVASKQFSKIKKESLKETVENKHMNKKRRRISKDLKATKTLGVVIGTFCVCWCPFFIIFTVMQYHQTLLTGMGQPWKDIVFTSFVLVFPNLNSMCNPIIYTFFNSDFRRGFWKVLLELFKSKESTNTNSSSFKSSSFNALLQTARQRSATSATLNSISEFHFHKSCNLEANQKHMPVIIHADKKITRHLETFVTTV